jgi:predicted nucleic acid-binding Zn ribbon protein
MTEPALKECPECGSSIRRLIGPGVGVIFKGSGFYQTDYKTCPSGGCPEKGAQKKTGTCSSGDKCSCDE